MQIFIVEGMITIEKETEMTIVETETGMITGGIEMTTTKTEIIIMINMKSVTSMLIHQQLKELSEKAQMEGK